MCVVSLLNSYLINTLENTVLRLLKPLLYSKLDPLLFVFESKLDKARINCDLEDWIINSTRCLQHCYVS